MRTLRNSLWPRSGRRANLRRWLIASGVTLICFSALFFKASTHAQSHTSKRARQTSADREKKGRTAKLERRRENEPIQEDVERRENWFWSQRMYPFDDLPDDARRKAADHAVYAAIVKLANLAKSPGKLTAESAKQLEHEANEGVKKALEGEQATQFEKTFAGLSQP